MHYIFYCWAEHTGNYIYITLVVVATRSLAIPCHPVHIRNIQSDLSSSYEETC